MTTIKGVMRSYGAAVRRAERTQQKHNREAAKRYKLQLKEQALVNASIAVQEYNAYIKVLKSVHKDFSEPIVWEEILNSDPPFEPEPTRHNEERVKSQIDNFKPSFLDKLFGYANRLRTLDAQLIQARQFDESYNRKKHNEFKEELADYYKLHNIAAGILNKDVNAYKDALEYFTPFEDIIDLSKQLKFKLNPNYIEVEMEVLSYSFIPGNELSLTSTGKLSQKNMAVSKYYELFQEHICSTVIRIAKEISIYFPVNYVLITVVIDELDSATGHRVNNVKLSTVIPVVKIKDVVIDGINPIDCVKSFIHNMKFVKTTGFTNVNKIDMETTLLSY